MLGVVLIGGASRRFGSPKQEIEVDGLRLLERSRAVLVEALGAEPIVSGGAGLPDLRPGQGPLAGLESVLVHAPASVNHVLLLACDLPGVSAGLVRLLAECSSAADVVLPLVGGRRHPLCARWHRRTLPAIQAALDAGRRSVNRLLESLTVEELDEAALTAAGLDPHAETWNVNRPGDLQRFLTR